MSAVWVQTLVYLAWLFAAACFVLGLHQMNSPATARAGNRLSAAGMTVAVVATLVFLIYEGISGAAVGSIVVGLLIGGGNGLYHAPPLPLTRVPPLRSPVNAVGGGG